MAEWDFIIFESFAGEAGKCCATGETLGVPVQLQWWWVDQPARLFLWAPHGRS